MSTPSVGIEDKRENMMNSKMEINSEPDSQSLEEKLPELKAGKKSSTQAAETPKSEVVPFKL